MKQGHWFQEWKVELPQMLVYFITNAGKNELYRCGYQWDLWGRNGPRKLKTPFVVELVLCAFYQIESFRVLLGIPKKHIYI